MLILTQKWIVCQCVVLTQTVEGNRTDRRDVGPYKMIRRSEIKPTTDKNYLFKRGGNLKCQKIEDADVVLVLVTTVVGL